MNIAELLEFLRVFDIIQTPHAVIRLLAGRFSTDEGGLFRLSPETIWVITEDEAGVRIVDRQPHSTGAPRQLLVPAPSTPVLDSTGAGDAVLASLLFALDRRRMRGPALSVGVIAKAVADAEPLTGSILQSLGARGHLPNRVPADMLPTAMPVPLAQLRDRLDPDRLCTWCGAPPETRDRSKPYFGGRRNLGLLQQRIATAGAANHAIEQARHWLAERGTTVICGTGGSYSVAVHLTNLINRRGGFASERRPAEFLAVSPLGDRFLAVSYSGNSHDLGLAVRRALDLGYARVAVLTINPQPEIAAVQHFGNVVEVICYGSRRLARERGFVSIAGTVMPAAVWTAASIPFPTSLVEYAGPSAGQLEKLGDAIARELRYGYPIEIYATGWSRSAAVDLESKLTESGVGVVRVHDTKDFSHGRFVGVLEREQGAHILISVGERTDYESTLLSVLGAGIGATELRFPREAELGGFDALVGMQSFAVSIGDALGVDISRPRAIPEPGLRLYKWEGDLP